MGNSQTFNLQRHLPEYFKPSASVTGAGAHRNVHGASWFPLRRFPGDFNGRQPFAGGIAKEEQQNENVDN